MRAASVAARLPVMNEAGASPARWPALLRVFALACLGLLMSVGLLPRARAQDVQAVPALSGRVIDQTGTLTAAQRQASIAVESAWEEFQALADPLPQAAEGLPAPLSALQAIEACWEYRLFSV